MSHTWGITGRIATTPVSYTHLRAHETRGAQVHLEDHHEGIVSREQFERVQTMIQMGLLHSGRKKYNDEQQKVLNDPKWQ